MANQSRKGFRPLYRLTGQEFLFPVDAANGASIFVDDLVSMVAAGAVNASTAGDANIVAGSVVELFDSNKVPIGAWNSTVTTKYLPASTAGYALVALALPGRLYLAQTATIITSAAIGATTDHIVGSGSTVTGTSAGTINGNDLNTGGQFIIVGSLNSPTNDITLASAQWIVAVNESIYSGTGKAVGV